MFLSFARINSAKSPVRRVELAMLVPRCRKRDMIETPPQEVRYGG